MFFITEAIAQDGLMASGAGAGAAGGSSMMSLLPMVLIFAVFYFLMIRPQQKKIRDHQKMVAALRRGDKVITAGGIVGKVAKVSAEDSEILVEIADGVQIRVVKSTISQVVAKPEPANSNGTANAA